MTKVTDPSASYDLSAGLAEQARLIQWHVGVWHDLGYAEPLPSPDCNPIPPLGRRSSAAIEGGHAAVKDIDEMIRQLHALRGQLVSELRQDSDIRGVRVDAMLAEHKALACPECGRSPALHRDGVCLYPRTDAAREVRAQCGCPTAPGQIRHQRGTCTDPVVAKLDWHADDERDKDARVELMAGRRDQRAAALAIRMSRKSDGERQS